MVAKAAKASGKEARSDRPSTMCRAKKQEGKYGSFVGNEVLYRQTGDERPPLGRKEVAGLVVGDMDGVSHRAV